MEEWKQISVKVCCKNYAQVINDSSTERIVLVRKNKYKQMYFFCSHQVVK